MPEVRKTILIVEADPLHLAMMRRVLRAEGYRILAAADFQDAVNVHHQHRGEIDLLLSALALPGRNGYALAEALLAAQPGLRLLFVTAESGAKLSQFMKTPMVHEHILGRPFEPAQLVRMVKNILGGMGLAAGN